MLIPITKQLRRSKKKSKWLGMKKTETSFERHREEFCEMLLIRNTSLIISVQRLQNNWQLGMVRKNSRMEPISTNKSK